MCRTEGLKITLDLPFQNGYLSAIPYVVIFMVIFPVSWTAQQLVNRKILTLQTQRKLFNSLGSYGSAAALVWLAFVKCNVTEAVIAISVAVGLLAFVTPGVWVSSGQEMQIGAATCCEYHTVKFFLMDLHNVAAVLQVTAPDCTKSDKGSQHNENLIAAIHIRHCAKLHRQPHCHHQHGGERHGFPDTNRDVSYRGCKCQYSALLTKLHMTMY